MEHFISHFNTLTPEQIVNQVPGRWGDIELLDIAEHFREAGDKDHEVAIYELVLRSPEVSEMVDYWVLYDDLVQYYRNQAEYQIALRWAYARIAFDEQHEEGVNRQANNIDLADIYFQSGDIDSGITIYTQLLQVEPDNLWLHTQLGRTLLEIRLAPLAVAVLEEGQSRIGKESSDFFKEQLIELHGKATSQTPHPSDLMTIIEPRVMSEFESALKAEPTLAQEFDELEPYPQTILRLMEVAAADEEDLYAEIMGLGPPSIPTLIRLAYDQNPKHITGSKHALVLLRRMNQNYPSELEMLSDWLAEAEGDWQRTLLSSTMGKIGGYQTKDLSGITANTDLDTGVRISALLALKERALTIPDQHKAIIDHFRHLLTRPEANDAPEEQFIGALIDIACDLNARELYPEIRQAYDEDRVDTFYITLADVHEVWGLERLHTPERRTDGMYLPLKCKACGRTREHFTQYVMVEVDTLDRELEDESEPFDPYILDHAIECPKCHSVDHYEFTPMAFARITGPEIFQAIATENTGKKAPKIKPNPRVFYFRSGVLGEPMHPLVGLDEYRRRLTIQPKNTDLLLGLGTLFRTILRYPEALQAHRNACELAPNNPEVLFTCALTEHDLGDSENARSLYQQVIDLGKTLKAGEDRFPSEITIAAIKGLQSLNQGRPSPWEGQFLNQAGHPVPHPSITYKPHPIRKKRTKRGRRRKR